MRADAAAPRAGRDVIVVTGAGGFLGSRVVSVLRRATPRARVIAVLRRRRSGARLPAGVRIVYGDLRSAVVWHRLPSTVTHVFHLAAAIPWDRRRADGARVVLDNVAPVAHLIERSAGWAALRQVVYASSVSVYEPSARKLRESSSPLRPTTPYGAAKLVGEQLLVVLRARGVAVASLRFSSLYGVGQYQGTVLPILAGRARRGLPLQVFNPQRVQDFLHVDDAARAVWLAYRRRASGAFNVGTGRAVTMAALADAIGRCVRAPRPSDIVTNGGGDAIDPGVKLDIARARRALGYRPRITLEGGLARLARGVGVSAS